MISWHPTKLLINFPYETGVGIGVMLDLSRVREREALRSRREPYWQRLRPGWFVGYRPSRRGGVGTWIARAYEGEGQAYRLKALGDFGDIPGRDRFAAAKQEAEMFAATVEGGGVAERRVETVRDACEQYAGLQEDIAARFRRHIYEDPIASVKMTKLRRHHLRAWRERLEQKPVFIGSRSKPARTSRARSPASVNRDMAMLRAALNRILAPGTPDTEAAWQEALKPIRNADRQRTLYLDRDQRRQLLQSIDPEAEPFVRTLCTLPLRPGAVANLAVADFDERTSELSIGKDKSGRRRRLLVPPGVARLLKAQTAAKPEWAPLFARLNGQAWDKESWKRPIAKAAALASLPRGTTAYALRHSTITDLVNAGLPLLAVAQISDTSAEMIERHYGHLNRALAAQALEGLAL